MRAPYGTAPTHGPAALAETRAGNHRQNMKTNNALQVIFSAFFLGLVVVAFVGIGVNTFYPEPPYGYEPGSAHSSWQLITGIILPACATVLLAVSLFLGDDKGALSNGLSAGCSR